MPHVMMDGPRSFIARHQGSSGARPWGICQAILNSDERKKVVVYLKILHIYKKKHISLNEEEIYFFIFFIEYTYKYFLNTSFFAFVSSDVTAKQALLVQQAWKFLQAWQTLQAWQSLQACQALQAWQALPSLQV